jgi:hypothetical protein
MRSTPNPSLVAEILGDYPVGRLIFGAAGVLLAFAPALLVAAEMDEVCVQRLIGAQNKRLQHCSEKFQGEHRDLCETAARLEHAKAMQICRSRGDGGPPKLRGR